MKVDVCDVLVVGLGPVGDVFSGLLQTQGISVIAIDREADIYPLPRAAIFDEEVTRIFQMMGVAEDLLPFCATPPGFQFRTANHELLLNFDVPPGFGPYGWAASYSLHQPSIEKTLRNRLVKLGVDIRLSTQFLKSSQDENGIVATVENAKEQYQIQAKYLVWCDGARSPVRESIGVDMFDYSFEESWLVIDGIIENNDDMVSHHYQLCDPNQPTTYLKMSKNRFRWEFMLKPGDDSETFASETNLAQLLEPWNVLHRIKLERSAIYRFRGLLANSWRRGRVMLAGDAAHQMPPFAGQGMCSGIRDAGNLAWKLTAVIRGKANERLLDTYQQEREPHVRAIIERSIEFGRTVCMLDKEAAARRDDAMLAARAAGEAPPMVPYPPLLEGCLTGGPQSGELFIQPVINDIRMDDVIGNGPWLFTSVDVGSVSTTVDFPKLKKFVIGSVELGVFSHVISNWLAHHETEAVLVRPDRHVFGVGSAEELARLWQEMLIA